jgi:SRSO17 transposase
MGAEEAEKKMTKRIEVAKAPAPLEEYVKHFDPLFGKSNQRDGFRRYIEGLLLPSERHKTLTGLVNTEPIVGAQLPRAQALQWFLTEADWDERQIQESRLQLLREDPTTAPTSKGVLVIDETGDRKAGDKTAHVGRQYLGKLGKVDNPTGCATRVLAFSELAPQPLWFTPREKEVVDRGEPAPAPGHTLV